MAATLPPLQLDPSTIVDKIDPSNIASQWLHVLQTAIAQKQWSTVEDLFVAESWWRDILALDWDWTSKSGPSHITNLLKNSTHGFGEIKPIAHGGLQAQYCDMGPVKWIQTGFTFENSYGTGRGVVRLTNTGPDTWKAWTMFTWLEDLRKQNDKRSGSDELEILVVGAGQSGLALAYELKALGLNYRIVEQNSTVGDSWRKRYDILTSHTPKFADHYPGLPYPDSLPRWLKRDDIASWQEHYAKTMGLDIQLSTVIEDMKFDNASKTYTMRLRTPKGTEELKTKHVALASGMFAPTPVRPKIPNQDSFQGRVLHTMEFKSGAHFGDISKTNFVIIGSGTSAHDVGQDLAEHNAGSVSMIQRHAIFSMSRKAQEATVEALWNTPGVSTDEADVLGNSFPFSVLRTLGAGQSMQMSAIDQEMLKKLEEKGLAVMRGDSGWAWVEQAFINGGKFYIDQGANQYIIDGRIRVYHDPEGVQQFSENGVQLGNGTHLPADVVIFATGFERNDTLLEGFFGSDIRTKIGDFGHLDEESERIGWWRPSGVPNLWYMTGSFRWSRQFSKTLALQIKAVEDNLNKDYYARLQHKSRKAVV